MARCSAGRGFMTMHRMNALYSLYDALVSINVPSDKARAVVDAMERDMTALLATKDDLKQLELATRADLKQLELATRADLKQLELATRSELKLLDKRMDSLDQRVDSTRVQLEQKMDSVRTELRHEITLLRSSMTVRLGSMLIGGITLLFAALKLTA